MEHNIINGRHSRDDKPALATIRADKIKYKQVEGIDALKIEETELAEFHTAIEGLPILDLTE